MGCLAYLADGRRGRGDGCQGDIWLHVYASKPLRKYSMSIEEGYYSRHYSGRKG